MYNFTALIWLSRKMDKFYVIIEVKMIILYLKFALFSSKFIIIRYININIKINININITRIASDVIGPRPAEMRYC